MTLSDKLFYWVFQNHPDRILELQPDLAQVPGGYRFSAPAQKSVNGVWMACSDPRRNPRSSRW